MEHHARAITLLKILILLQLPKENLSEADINAKSTSDHRKRRIAHVPKFPLPVIKKPTLPVIKKKKRKLETKLSSQL